MMEDENLTYFYPFTLPRLHVCISCPWPPTPKDIYTMILV